MLTIKLRELHVTHIIWTPWLRLIVLFCMTVEIDAKGNVRIWDTTQDDHKLKYEYRPIGGSVEDIQWTEDSKRIVVGGMGQLLLARHFHSFSVHV